MSQFLYVDDKRWHNLIGAFAAVGKLYFHFKMSVYKKNYENLWLQNRILSFKKVHLISQHAWPNGVRKTQISLRNHIDDL